MRVEYDEIAELMRDYSVFPSKITDKGEEIKNVREFNWYEGIWRILAGKDVTEYENNEEYNAVVMRAIAMNLLLNDYYYMVNGFHAEYEDFAEIAEGKLRRYDIESNYEEQGNTVEDNKNLMLAKLANTYRNELVDVLIDELGEENLFYSFYAIDYIPRWPIAKTAEGFWNSIVRNKMWIKMDFDKNKTDAMMEAYSWCVEKKAPALDIYVE